MKFLALVFLTACSGPGCGGSASQTTTSEPTPEPATGESVAEAETPAPTERQVGEETPPVAPAAPSTVGWAEVLTAHVTSDDGFRYAALIENEAHRALLNAYVEAIGAADVEGWSRDEQLAFYINAYNALTVHSVLELWPVTSVMQEDGFFDERPHQVAGNEVTLNGLENDIIRSERFGEPRIHFAVNCASVGCPPLFNQPFSAENLEASLSSLTETFVRATSSQRGRRVQVSQLFEWFADDFGGPDGVRNFIAEQLEGELKAAVENTSTRIAFTPYDWDVNARP